MNDAPIIPKILHLTLHSNLSWRRETRMGTVPVGTGIIQAMTLLGFDEPEAHCLCVINGAIALPGDILTGDTVLTVFPVMSGG